MKALIHTSLCSSSSYKKEKCMFQFASLQNFKRMNKKKIIKKKHHNETAWNVHIYISNF